MKKRFFITGIRAVILGIIANTFLGLIKVIAGVVGHSYALIADGIESAADVFSSLVVLQGLHLANKDADEHYHYGYGKAEPLAAAIVAITILGAAIVVFIISVKEIITPHHPPEAFTLIILVVVVITKELMYRKIKKVSKLTNSLALQGDALHHRADSITSIAAFIGIVVALVGGTGWEEADDYAALLCSFVIAWSGVSLLRNSIHELMDKAPEEDLITRITDVASKVEGVILIEKLLVRKSGMFYFVGMHVHADPQLSLHDAHILSGKVKSAVKKLLPLAQDILVHMEPAED